MKIERCFEVFEKIDQEMSKVIIGQKKFVWGFIIGLFAPVPYTFRGKKEHRTGCGHILLDARPGTGKTIAAETLAAITEAAGAGSSRITGLSYKRIQCTSDITPTDITGGRIYNKETSRFEVEKGPIFANIVVFDEINRANTRSKSAILEGLQEGRVTIAKKTYSLPFPFFGIKTQNPVEQEGVYVSGEAEKDRSMFKIVLPRLSSKERERIAGQDFTRVNLEQAVRPKEIIEIRKIIREKVFPDAETLWKIARNPDAETTRVQKYIIRLIEATDPKTSNVEMALDYLDEGALKAEKVFTKEYLEADIASDRCGQHFLAAAKAQAFLNHRLHVTPNDIKQVTHPVMRHRLMLNNKALAYAMKNQELEVDMADRIISAILNEVPIP